MNFITISNHKTVELDLIPVLSYTDFTQQMKDLLHDPGHHCAAYFCCPEKENSYRFFAVIADDSKGDLYIFSCIHPYTLTELEALSASVPSVAIFEREIHENFGIKFRKHPWLKPVRYSWNRANKSDTLDNYPFYKLLGTESHEVGVGPIHAGIIEPGHFRFSCYGEIVQHLEIQLGYQHRGIEELFLSKKTPIQRTVLAESVAGDSVIGHSVAFVRNMELLYGLDENDKLAILRTIASELERIAMHTGNLSAVCQDIAYQLGSSVFGALRTPVINYLQGWCGSRVGKGLIRIGYNPYPYSENLKERLLKILEDFELRYVEMSDAMFRLPSVQARLEKTGIVTKEQARIVGSVGLAARITGIPRDIRTSHPYGHYKKLFYMPAVGKNGDAMSHAQVRDQEIKKSVRLLKYLVDELDKYKNEETDLRPDLKNKVLKKESLSVSLTEGWRGEICHIALTDSFGELSYYKIKDPSMHNWLSLALAMRDNEISDFPICNKSYDLSYCGFDL